MTDRFIQTQALYTILELEPYFILGALVLLTWLFYKFFLREVSEERHRNIKNHFKSLVKNYALLSLFFFSFLALHSASEDLGNIVRIKPYLALLAFTWGAVVFIRTCRLLVLQYLFMGSIQAGVPLLIVNIFSLILSLVILFWGASRFFGFQLGPLLATSAAFSIVLGLALQDTLGNLFAGISLQLDKSFEIGDWLEVVSGIQKCTGQVKELSWRSTVLQGLNDELITLPNRFMAQAQLSNFSPPEQPIVRSQIFRIEYGAPVEKVKELLEKACSEISDVRGLPAPYAYVNESTEHWLSVKVLYFIDSYGSQWTIGDKVLRKGLEALTQAGIKGATQKLEIIHGPESSFSRKSQT